MAILFMMSGILLKDKVEKYYKLWWLYIPLIACALLAVRFDIISHSLPYFTNRINIIYIYIYLCIFYYLTSALTSFSDYQNRLKSLLSLNI
jgi:hypothetical protein